MVTCQPAMFDDTKGYPFCCSQQQLPQIGRSAWTWSSGRRVMKSDVWTCSLAKICERQRPYVKNSDSSSTNMDLTWFISATVMIWLTTMVISPTKNHGDCSGSFPRNGWVFFLNGNIMERKGEGSGWLLAPSIFGPHRHGRHMADEHVEPRNIMFTAIQRPLDTHSHI